PTLTPGKETTTTTGSGTATGNLNEKEEEVKEIDLDKELGENPDISWDIKQGDKAVEGKDYTVQEVKNDGNKQTLVLRKEDTKTAEMTAEDIAKLVDAEKPTVNPDGTYTLTRTETILDAEGNPQTRTTYITIRDNKVTTKTTTELTITREKAEQNGEAKIEDKVEYPSITVTNQAKPEDTQTITPDQLKEMLDKGEKKDDGIHYTAPDGKEYVIQETTQPGGTPLSNAEIVAKLNNERYTLGADGEIYYTTPHNETVKLDVTQNELLRRSLTYTVTLKTTTEGEKGTAGEQNATEDARRDATRDALTKAVDALGVDTATASQLKAKISDLNFTKEQLDNGGTFTETIGGKTYTLTYSAAGAEVTKIEDATKPDVPGKNPEDIIDVKNHTVTGTAYVTGSKITYLHGEKYETTGMGGLGIGADFKTAPPDADPDSIQKDTAGRITSYKDKDGKTYRFTYKDDVKLNDLTPEEKAALEAAANQPGWTTENLTANLTRVSWTVMSPETTKPKTEDIVDASPIDLVNDNNWSQTDNNGTFDFTHGSKTYAGMTLDNTSEDGKTKTYKKTEANGTVTIITVTTQELTEEEIKAKFDKQFGAGEYTMDAEKHTVTYKKDGKTYKASYVDLEEELTVEVQKPDVVAATGSTDEEAQKAFLEKLEEARKEAEKNHETLVIEYTKDGKIETLVVDRKMTWDEVVVVVRHVVNYNAMTDAELVTYLKELEKTAQEDGKYYTGSTDWDGTPYYWDDASGKMQRVPPEKKIDQRWYGDYVIIDGEEHRVHYNRNDIDHLDLATDSHLTLSEKKDGKSQTTDCVLLNPTLKWSENAETLVNGGGTQANFVDRITYDDEGDKDKNTGHHEYPRASWDDDEFTFTEDNAPTKSVFYKVTGTVAYGKLGGDYKKARGERGYAAAKQRAVDALEKYKAENPGLDLSKAQVVEIYKDQTKGGGEHYYQIYLYQSDLTAYGYMSDDNNTCGNALFNADGQSYYVGGYDLTLGNLTQTDKKHVVAMGKNTIALSATFMRTKKLPPLTNKELNYTPISKEWVEVTPSTELRKGEGLSGSYQANYTKTADYTVDQQKGIEGTGTGSYKSFTNLIRNIFNGDGKGTVEGGSIKYVYHTEKTKDGDPVPFEAEKMVVTTKQDAEVHYTFTSQESRDVWIKGYTQTVVPPVNPGPDAPELPPVEDAKP
ncbi:hypothetical protein ACSTB5_12685, partial [Faecalibacterium duncaniae]|uniref:hypothetical protein n=1 Tax=Faecalibacterium duncaniae (strain DSM 17677 / JCM 31915 / A2-165) TaxID=411483 RepID=UPI003EDA350C